ncbi:PREDICTED: pentatricopeptide repeat-containing protein At3g21470 [Tarenaya hassleriana]|uniref:pentatricopeptide repeat-containing protein At3g21470 n=1 Tax=Tarenaya hassleriana TaxID=28532 RepID=UPI00053C29B4|nr:PREDICTED: pentatricopeptide repeat-containing protein At3g21470 [Tarenaya hassleriana]
MKQEEASCPDHFHVSKLIRSHLSRGSPGKALVLYGRIRRGGVYFPGWVPLLLKACSCVPTLVHGKLLHSESMKSGICSDVMVGSSLINMYGECGCTLDARKVFDEMPDRNVATWNAMIGGYMRNGDTASASSLFETMPIKRNTVTWIEMIKGFGKRGETAKARDLFERMPLDVKNVKAWGVMLGAYASNGEMEAASRVFEDTPEKNPFIWSLMISGFFRIGEMHEATAIFDRVLERNLVIWNSLISGYAQNGYAEEAIDAFYKMQEEGFEPDEVTVSGVLSACAQLGRLDVGKEVHFLITRKGIEFNQFVSNALIDMYAKCGDLINSRLVFGSASQKNVACWNSMISCLAIHGEGQEALEIFRTMENSDKKPDDITYLAVLSACVHAGFLEEGLKIFSEMEEKGVKPNVKHFGCLVDLLGRSGRLKEAYGLVTQMPLSPNDTVLGALLGACGIHLDTEIAEKVMKQLETERSKTGSGRETHFVSVSNVYAYAERWQTAEEYRRAMEKSGVRKVPGHSSLIST